MNKIIQILTLISAINITLFGQENKVIEISNSIEHVYLDENVTHQVYISSSLPTTIYFDKQIDSILPLNIYYRDGENSELQVVDTNLPMSLVHRKGTTYFTINSFKEEDFLSGANIIIDGKVYPFNFKYKDNSTRVVYFYLDKDSKKQVLLKDNYSVVLKTAQLHENLIKTNPSLKSKIVINKDIKNVSYYDMYEVEISEIIKFKNYDAIVVKSIIYNKSPKELKIKEDTISVKINGIYIKPSEILSSKVLKPYNKGVIYSLITGDSSESNIFENNFEMRVNVD